MKRNLSLFFCSILVGAIGAIGFAWFTSRPAPAFRYVGSPIENLSGAKKLGEAVFVRGQISLDDIPNIKKDGYSTLIDLRPDGEASDQPPAADVARVAQANRLKFNYIPVSPGKISEDAVNELARVLETAEQPVLLYCRSGSRGARTWALAEASRLNGLDAERIALIVRETGYLIDDIKPAIEAKVFARSKVGQ